MEVITLQNHDDQWEEIFKSEKELIFKALGQNIKKIHHVGSTGVPDLLAKPIIDIAVEATSYPPSKTIIDKLAAIEYEPKGEGGVRDGIGLQKGIQGSLIFISVWSILP